MADRSASSLGEIIRQQRELAELSMRQFAELAGISNPYLSQIERGLRAPSETCWTRSRARSRCRPTRCTSRPGWPPPGSEPEANAVLDAIAADPRLTARQRAALREVYEAFVAVSPRHGAGGGRVEPGPSSRPTAARQAADERPGGAGHRRGRRHRPRHHRAADRRRLDVLAVDLTPDADGPGVPFDGRPHRSRGQRRRGRRGAGAVRPARPRGAERRRPARVADRRVPGRALGHDRGAAADQPVPAGAGRLAGAARSPARAGSS